MIACYVNTADDAPVGSHSLTGAFLLTERAACSAVQRCLRPEIPNTTVPMQSRLQAAEIINTARGSPRSIIIA